MRPRTKVFFKPILVSDFLAEETTFQHKSERMAQLRGLRVHLTYDPVRSDTSIKSPVTKMNARTKFIAGGGLAISRQPFDLLGRDGAPDTKTTVHQRFKTSSFTIDVFVSRAY